MILPFVLVAFALLAAGTYRQSEQLFGRVAPLRARMGLIFSGYFVLGLSLALVLGGPDVARQLVQWFGLLTIGALAMLVSFWARAS